MKTLEETLQQALVLADDRLSKIISLQVELDLAHRPEPLEPMSAGWMADKIGALGDYGKGAARILRQQEHQIAELEAQVVNLTRERDEARAQLDLHENKTQLYPGEHNFRFHVLADPDVFDATPGAHAWLNRQRDLAARAERERGYETAVAWAWGPASTLNKDGLRAAFGITGPNENGEVARG